MRIPARAAAAALATVGLVAALGAPFAGAQAAAPNDPLFDKQFGLTQMRAPEAWSASRGDGVTIAIVDSGVDTAHPDLKDKLVAGRDFADSDDNPDDDSTARDGSGASVRGHGTHVAGIAAAITDNGVGVAGTAPASKIMPLKAFTSGGGSLLGFTAVPDAIRYAVNNGAKVINLSLGTFSTGVSIVGFIEAPCADALARGVLCVVAAGNSGDQDSGYPKDFPGLVVAAGTNRGTRAEFSQRADTQWSIMAPGQAIRATVPVEDGSYGDKSGTSMAAPHVAGVAALVYAKLKPPGSAAGTRQVIDAILGSAVVSKDPGAGAGLVDAAAALGVPVAASRPAAGTDDGGGAPPTPARPASSGPVGGVVAGGGTAPARGPAAAAPTATTAAPTPVAEDGLAPLSQDATDEAADQEAAALLQPRAAEPEPTAAETSTLGAAAIAAGLLVLGTGAWSGVAFADDRRRRRIKPFQSIS